MHMIFYNNNNDNDNDNDDDTDTDTNNDNDNDNEKDNEKDNDNLFNLFAAYTKLQGGSLITYKYFNYIYDTLHADNLCA